MDTSHATTLLVVDADGGTEPPAWSAQLAGLGLHVLDRTADRNGAPGAADELEPDAVVVVVGSHDDLAMISSLGHRPTIAAVAEGDPVAVADCLQAGATGVVVRGRELADEIASALRDVLADRAHVSTGASRSVATGLRDRRLGVVVSPAARLTDRETDVLDLVADGLTNPQIAEALQVSRKTVKNHLTSAYAKLGVSGRDAAVRIWRDLAR